MNTLPPNLRKQLERTIVPARDVAETGAREALEALAVHYREPYAHMSADQRTLRQRLRARGRQLGDSRHPHSRNQAIEHLVHECAYEHWHGMLFARFLAENQLLIEPELGVAVTLDECEELGKDEGADKWTMAARFAHRMLPQVFRPDHPAFEVRLAREHRLKLEGLAEDLPPEIFTATDSLGWVYQFWQSKKKTDVNRSEVKIGADELPAVTQLFTEPYMVSFLLDNSLGAWWATRRLSQSDLQEAETEADLRRKAAIPGAPLDFLRFVRSGDTAAPTGWRPAAGAFDGWPEHLGDLKVLDPCCGSGHFLVAAFTMLVPMRMEREGLAVRDAVDAVLQENLHGLELDPRCVALAAFALALAAWTYPGTGGYRPLPGMNLACSGLAPNATKEQWITLAEQAADAGGMPAERDLFGVDDNLLSAQLRSSLEELHELFEKAPERGSLLDPRTLKGDLFQSDYESVRSLFAAVLEGERVTDEQAERAVTAQGMARASELMAGRYHLVITNVPYLARGKQSETLRDFCQNQYRAAKNDLATVFLERCLELCIEGGTASLVLPQNWLFLKSYKKLRERLLKTETWHLLARLGPGAFETISGEVVKAILLNLGRGNSRQQKGRRSSEKTGAGMMYGLDVSEFRTASEKAASLREVKMAGHSQRDYLKNPHIVITTATRKRGELLANIADYGKGSTTGDGPRFLACFWEFPATESHHVKWLNSPNETEWSGRMQLCKVPLTDQSLDEQRGCWIRGQRVFGRRGVAVNKMQRLEPFLYTGEVFDDNICPISPRDAGLNPAVWSYVQSDQYHQDVRSIDQALKVTAATLTQAPFDLDHWTKVAGERYPNGLPLPYSDDPTQWIFHGHPCGSVVWDAANKWTAHGPLRTDPTALQVAVARLLGYCWPAEQDAEMELAAQQREWVARCEDLLFHADKDGIVCIPSVRGEPPAGDRLLELLAAAFGDAWNDGVLSKLLAEVGSATLDDYLRHRFFDEHCKLFHHRPFVWHIHDGRRDGFQALVNYHKLAEGGCKGRQLLESLTWSYLGDWITRNQDGVRRGEGGADDRLVAALELQQRLAAIIQGEPPFDIFVRWKPLNEQPIGWEPDINDGVRLNIRPFMAEDIPGGKKGAGVLHAKPNLHWRKDRGKEPLTRGKRSRPPWLEDEDDWDPDDDKELRPRDEFPWFWHCPGAAGQAERTDFPGGPDFDGNRWNDLHYTAIAKHYARVQERERTMAPELSG